MVQGFRGLVAVTLVLSNEVLEQVNVVAALVRGTVHCIGNFGGYLRP